MKRVLTVLLAVGLLGAGCNDSPTLPDPVDPNAPVAPLVLSSVFPGSLTAGGTSVFFSFPVPVGPSSIRIMLASVTTGLGDTVTTPLGLGIGIPQGFGCEVFLSATAVPGLAYQLSTDVEAGTYCLDVSDVGSLTVPVDFAVRIDANPQIVRGATSSPIVFQSMLTEFGSSSRTFSPPHSGTATVTLDAVGPTPVAVGVGIGIPDPNGGGCLLSRTVTAGPGTGTLFSMAVETGVYCVQIFDVGNVVDSATFTMTIVHPEG